MKKYIFTLLSFMLVLASCEVDSDLNIDQKNPSSVPSSGLFANGTRNFFDRINGWHENRLYAQYWAQTTYPEASQYVMTGLRNNVWATIYSNVLQDFKGAKELIIANNEENATNKLAIIDMMEVFAYSTLVDNYGDIPYTEALDSDNANPKYDDAATIYSDLMSRLSADIDNLDVTKAGFGAGQDPVYGGDVVMWKKAASSLLLRLALRVADVDASKASAMAIKGAAGAITVNDENFGINYLDASPNTNPIYADLVLSGRNDYVAANTLVDIMNPLNDPRMGHYFEKKDGVYTGGEYGTANAASGFSAISDQLKTADLKGTVISASEVAFLKAEAVARGINLGGTVSVHYDNAITLSITEWGGSEADASNYLTQSSIPYATANGDWKEKIATQKWIAMYGIPFEGWTAWRLLDKPTLNAPEGMSYSDIPTRILYPTTEAQLNGTAYNSAASKIGGDEKTTKLFWDKN